MRVLIYTFLFCLAITPAQAGWKDTLKKLSTDSFLDSKGSGEQSQIARGLQEALQKGVQTAVNQLGAAGGYLNNPSVRIPLPKEARSVEKGLRLVGQGAMVDQFTESMNRAAEKAAPHAKDVFLKAISSMTFSDAQGVLSGPDNAATTYLDKTTRQTLFKKFLPIVKEMTDRYAVTTQYKTLATSANSVSTLWGSKHSLVTDIDSYVTNKGLDGLFAVIAEEEKNIRKNPVARTTKLLKTVFGQ